MEVIAMIVFIVLMAGTFFLWKKNYKGKSNCSDDCLYCNISKKQKMIDILEKLDIM